MTIGQTIYAQGTLYIEQCCACSVFFAIPTSMYNERQTNGGTFYCPNGHGQHYSKPETQKLKEQIEKLEQRVQWRDNTINEKNQQIAQLGYSLRAQKAAKTKILNRVKNGVCPCCNRTFANLQNHFKTKHPELLEA